MVKKTQVFTIQMVAEVRCCIEIDAEDWDDVVLKSNELKVPDFVTPVSGTVFDDWDNFEITGIFK